MSRRTAPHRRVLEIDRVGAWGSVRYHHRLDCGHVEVRPRRAGAMEIACLSCEGVRPLDSPIDPWADNSAQKELDAERMRLALATRLGISEENVRIVLDASGNVLGASISLDPYHVARFTTRH